jgi:hypothetical protein
MGVVWPLLRGKLNVKKLPPYPPKGESNKDTGGSSGKGLPLEPKENIAERLRRSKKSKFGGVVEATNGSSNRLREVFWSLEVF